MDFTTLKLTDIVSYIQQIRQLTWGSIPFWLSLAIPLLFFSLKNLLPAETSEETARQNRTRGLKNYFTLPRLIVFSSLFLFVLGVFTIKIESDHLAQIRNNGLRIKKYLTANNWYSLSRFAIKSQLAISDDELDKVLVTYPAEFLEIYDRQITMFGDTLVYNKTIDSIRASNTEDSSKTHIKNYNTENTKQWHEYARKFMAKHARDQNTIILTDSFTYAHIARKSMRILDAYLSNKKFDDGACFSYDSLFSRNPYFTKAIIDQLISDSSAKYCFGLCEGYQRAIVVKR